MNNIARMLLGIGMLVATGTLSAVQYVYPNSAGGYTTFSIGGTLNASTGDSLSFNGNLTSSGTSSVVNTSGTGNVVLYNLNAPTSYTITADPTASVITAISLGNIGDFDIPSSLSIIASSNFGGNVIGLMDNLSQAGGTINNAGSINSTNTEAGFGTAYGIELTGMNANNSGSITVSTTNAVSSIVPIGIVVNSGSVYGTLIANSGSISVIGSAASPIGIKSNSYGVTNSGSITASATSGAVTGIQFNNSGYSLVNASAGTITVSNTSGNTINGISANNSNIITNAGSIAVTGNSTSIDVYGIVATTVNAITNAGSIVLSGATSTGAGISATGVPVINNPGTITGGNFNGIQINSNATTAIITNTNGSITSFNNAIYVATGGSATINLNGGSITGTITGQSAGLYSINFGGPSKTTVNGAISNANQVTVAAGSTAALLGDVVSATGFTNSGTTVISGTRMLTATTITSTGALNFSITGATTSDNLTCSSALNLTSTTINVVSNFAPSINAPNQWTILSAPTLTGPAAATHLPFSPADMWSASMVSNTLVISAQPQSFTTFAAPRVNTGVAQALDAMRANITNAAQSAFLALINSVPSVSAYNAVLRSLIPNQNFSAQAIKLQNTIFNRAETRIAAVRDKTVHTGINAGDLNNRVSMWLAPFGSLAKQNTLDANLGFRARSLGLLIGIDATSFEDSLVGVAYGMSRSKVTEFSNKNFITYSVTRHGMIYGATNITGKTFCEWLLTGAVNHNNGNRRVLINGVNLNVTSNFSSYQAGGKFTLGVNNNIWQTARFAPVASVQYAYVHQPRYQESGSVAALSVQQNNSKILTIGAGARLSLTREDWWSASAREIRAVVTYDALAARQNMLASFLVGGNEFLLADNPERIALKLGVDFGFELSKHLVVQFSYDYELRRAYYDHAGLLKFKLVF